MRQLLLAGILTLAVTTAGAQSNNSFAVQTKVEKGILEGLYDVQSGLYYYLGIPFARPPIGPLRWKAPQELAPWKGVLPAKAFGARPVQNIVFGDMNSRATVMSEDCLYLNVWTPTADTRKKLPVLVYFYGGGFVAGDASEPRYDGGSMAAKGMVVVTVNYRLGIFGFFAHPELSSESPRHISGNYGLLDQHAALVWVQKNIAAFGGDPARVTIAGESAGSISVSYQMASPLSRGLIAGAIGESGAGIHPTLAPVTLAEAEKTGKEFADKAGVSRLEMLRKLSTYELNALYTQSRRFGFPIVIDGYFLTASLPEIFAAGKQAQVPLLLGWNSAEIPGSAFMQGQAYTPDNFQKRLKQEYPTEYEAAAAVYSGTTTKELECAATALASDRFIVYSTWKWFDLHRRNSQASVYRYLFTRVPPPAAPGAPSPLGAPHACEIEYCMGNLTLVKGPAWTSDDFRVSKLMQDYFANFIITGNPNGNKLPQWPAVKAGDTHPAVLVVDVEPKIINAPNDDRYLFLDKIYSRQP